VFVDISFYDLNHVDAFSLSWIFIFRYRPKVFESPMGRGEGWRQQSGRLGLVFAET
jgi:hypothetical protein